MKFLFLYFSLIFSALFSIVNSGFIKGWDIIVDFSNRDLISKYTLVFSLETPLATSDKIQIDMPYALHSSITSNSPDQLTATQGAVSFSTCSFTDGRTAVDPSEYILPSTFISLSIYTATATSTSYFLSVPSPLLANIEYVIVMTTSLSASSQAVGIYDFVKVSTVSSTSTSPIIYDSNELFSAFSLGATSAASLVVSYEVVAANQNDYAATYRISLEILNNIDYSTTAPAGSLYEIRFGAGSSSPFTFMSGTAYVCQTESSTSHGYVINSLSDSQYNCNISSNTIKIQVTAPLPRLSRLRFSFYVKNPSYTISTSESLEVKRLKINSRQVLERGSSAAFLYVSGITISSSSMKMGWGIDETLQVAPLNTPPIMKNAPTGVFTYNSIQFVFTPSHGTPDGVITELEFSIASATNGDAAVLTGSIIHNFPETQVVASRVECGVSGDGTTRIIKCSNMGSFVAGTTYFIGFKMMFINTATTISSTFSNISGYLLNASNNFARYTTPLISAYKLSQITTPVLTVNRDYYPPGTGSTAISSSVVSTSSPSKVYPPHADKDYGVLGIVPESTPNTPQKLIFTIALTNSDVSVINPSGYYAGFYLVTNGNIIEFDSKNPFSMDQYYVTLASQQLSTSIICQSSVYSSPSLGQYSRLKFMTTTYSDILNMFYNGLLFAIRNVFVRQHTSVYADDNVLDFYLYFFYDIDNFTPQFRYVLLYNAYTINSPKPFNLRYSLVNWYGGTTVINDGSYVPTLIRIAGYFNDDELKDGTCRLAVFFQGLTIFPDSTNILSYNTQCASSYGTSSPKCRGYPTSVNVDQNYSLMNRVEFQFSSDVPSGSVNSFEILIPVKSIASVTNIALFVSPMRYHDMIPTSSLAQASMKNFFYQPSSVYRLTGSNNLMDTTQLIQFNRAPNNIPLFNGYKQQNVTTIVNYSLDVSSNYVGENVAKVSINCQHLESYPVVGSNNLTSYSQENGSGFTFVTAFDFTSPQQSFFWDGGKPANIQKCLSFKYNQNSATLWRYGLFCAMEQGTSASVSQVNVTNFQLPYSYGITLPSTTSFAFSAPKGDIATLTFGSQTIGFPGVITPNIVAAAPILRMKSKNVRIAWSLKTTNPIPQLGYVLITLKDPLLLYTLGTVCTFSISTSHTCVVTQPTGVDTKLLFQLTNCGGCFIPAGQVQILHYGNDSPISPIPDNLFLIQTLSSSSVVIDQTSIALKYPSILRVDNLSSQSAIIAGDFQVEFPYQQGESDISVTFNTSDASDLLKDEILFVDFGLILKNANVNTINTQINCFIYQGDSISHSFTGATLVNTAASFTVSFTVKTDIAYSETNPYKIFCTNVRMPSFTTVSSLPSISLFKSDGTTKVLLSATSSFPSLKTSQLVSSAVTFSRIYFNTYGSVSKMTFNFQSSVPTYGSSCFLIRFSNSYLRTLSQDSSLDCSINGLSVPCYLSKPRTLLISGIPLSTQTFIIVVYGVQLPKINTGTLLHYFFVGLALQDDNTGALSLLNYGFVNDITTVAQQTNLFEINASVLSNANSKQINTLSFNFTLPNTFLASGQLSRILITFPIEWRYLLNLLTPTVSLRRVSTNTFLTITTTVSTYFDISFTWSGTPATTESFILQLINVANPESPMCILRKQWIFHVQKTTDSLTLFSRSVPMTSQIPYFKFNQQSNKLILSWKYPQGKSSFVLNRGPFKTLVTLVIENNSIFTDPIKIQLKSSNLFTLEPTLPFARPGDKKLSFYISALSETPTSSYAVYFVKTSDVFDAYTNLPICLVDVIQNDQALTYDNTNWPLLVPKKGISQPLIIGYANQGFLVNRDAQVTVSVVNGSTYGISVSGSSTKTLSSSLDNPKVAFFFAADTNAVVGIQVSIQVSIVITNSVSTSLVSLFKLPDEQILEVSLVGYNGSKFYIQQTELEVIQTNSILYKPSCPQTGVIYYKLFLNNIYPYSSNEHSTSQVIDTLTLRSEIKTNALGFYQFDPSDPLQKQYGFVESNPDLSSFNQFNISSLLSSKSYTIVTLCENSFSQQSSNILQFNFTTTSNGGIIQKVDLTFAKNLILPERIKAACFLSIFLQISPSNIYTSEKASCSDYLKQYDFQNSLNDITYFKQSQSSVLTVYFIPDWTVSSENITSIVKTAVSSSTFVFRLKRFITNNQHYYFSEWDLNLPDSVSSTFVALKSAGNLKSVTSIQPKIDVDYYIDINQDDKSLTVNIVRLTGNGFIFVGVEKILTNLLMQSAYDNYSPNTLMQGYNYLGSKVTFGVQQVTGSSKVESNFTFTGLTFTENSSIYEIFIAVSEEDPSPFSGKSTILKHTEITTSSLVISAGHILKISIMMILYICVSI